MFSFFKLREKESWRLVKTITEGIVHNESFAEGNLYYHLFESNKGNRRTEFASSMVKMDQVLTEKVGKRLPVYQERIYRWEMGRVDPDIPRYSQIPEEETANVIRGKID